MKDGYHSALSEPLVATPRERIQFPDGSLAFVHDLRKGIAPEWAACEVFYSDLPWRQGFAIFERRASSVKGEAVDQNRTYRDFLGSVSEVVTLLKAPVILVTGRQSMSGLPQPTHAYHTYLNGAAAVAMVYRTELRDSSNELAILRELAARFNVGGDFCCGYGRTAKIFARAGKRFVVSDFNPACIGYMAEEWEKTRTA